jgi:hypothetical protein
VINRVGVIRTVLRLFQKNNVKPAAHGVDQRLLPCFHRRLTGRYYHRGHG